MRRSEPTLRRLRMRFLLPLLVCGRRPFGSAQTVELSDAQALEIGRRIWKNECGGTVNGLTAWNAGEEFASLGIAHFIWYPEGKRGPFEESFPKLADYLARHGVRTSGMAPRSMSLADPGAIYGGLSKPADAAAPQAPQGRQSLGRPALPLFAWNRPCRKCWPQRPPPSAKESRPTSIAWLASASGSMR